MTRIGLDTWDVIPEDMAYYLRHHGLHFSKKACQYAVSKMKRRNGGKNATMTFTPKEDIEKLFLSHGVQLQEVDYDAVYLWHMAVADFYGSSLSDDKHVALYVKDVMEDPDGCDGMIFNRWYADMCRKGMSIDWEELA